MPLQLDEIDIKIIKSLVKDGRKSFRQISRETKITTPTVKARFKRLVNIGFIKGVIPIFDFNQIDKGEEDKQLIQIQDIKNDVTKEEEEGEGENTNSNIFKLETDKIKQSLISGLAIKMVCNFCKGSIYGKPKVLKFADIERFFCCNSCKSGYSEKYKGRIESIKRKYEGKPEF
jgi:DNA-binding Lrp family transcriptional regulator